MKAIFQFALQFVAMLLQIVFLSVRGTVFVVTMDQCRMLSCVTGALPLGVVVFWCKLSIVSVAVVNCVTLVVMQLKVVPQWRSPTTLQFVLSAIKRRLHDQL